MNQETVEAGMAATMLGFLIFCVILIIVGAVKYREPTRQYEVVEAVHIEVISTEPTTEQEPAEPVFEPDISIPLDHDLQLYIWEQSKQNNLDYNLLLAVIETESNFDPLAFNVNTNGTTDSGLFQINSCNYQKAYSMGLDPNVPEDNIAFACFMLSDLLSKYSLEDSLRAYNAGESGMKKGYGGEYALKILDRYGGLENENYQSTNKESLWY